MRTVQEWRSVLVVVTKTLAAYRLGRADSYEQLFTDDTSRRQTAIQNAVVGILTDGGFKMVNLLSGILAENETAKCLTGSIIRLFKEAGQLLDDWRIVLERLYPSCQDLLNMIPQLQALTLAKLANDAMVSTDTCNTARKTRHLLCKAVRTVAIEQGFREESINVMENDCWNHLCNVCFGAVIKELSSHLDEVLKDNLIEIHPILRVTTDPSNIFRAIEKFFGETANYAKGLGSMYYNYMRTYNPKAHHYQIARALVIGHGFMAGNIAR
jgi:hypothetical protein